MCVCVSCVCVSKLCESKLCVGNWWIAKMNVSNVEYV